jgi:hypothetical protein
MKSIITIFAIIIVGALFNLFAPWYIIALVSFALAFVSSEKGFSAFLSGFVAVFLLWLGTAVFQTLGNEGILVGRMSQLIGVSGFLLYLLTAIIGGLIGGFSALTGYLLRNIKTRKDTAVYYKVK